MAKKTESVYVILNDEGERPNTYGQQARVFINRGQAIKRCPKGYCVLELKVCDGEVIHNG